jgi:hypothetical protein
MAFIWLVIKFFKAGFNSGDKQLALLKRSGQVTVKQWLKLGIMAAMITIIIHGLVDVPYFKNDLAILFWIIMALI